jgi:hypothetical protein
MEQDDGNGPFGRIHFVMRLGLAKERKILAMISCHLKKAIFGRRSNYTARTATLPTPVT